MERKEASLQLGYCGLVCSLCLERDHCGGCKSATNCCGRHLSEEGCYQFQCCQARHIEGCWQCEEGPCERDMFSSHHDIRNRVFVQVAKNEGPEVLLDYVLKNHQAGICYGYQQDYDGFDEEEPIVDLLHYGIESKWHRNKG